MITNIFDVFPDFDDFNQSDQEELLNLYTSDSILNFNQIQNGVPRKAGNHFEGIRTHKTFEDISNEYADSTPFGKNSSFYIAKENSYRSLLEKKGTYHSISNKFFNIDLEKISWEEYSGTVNIKYQ